MATTTSAIFAEVMTELAAELTDAVGACAVTRTTQGAYDPATGTHSTTTMTDSGRSLELTDRDLADNFPDYVAGPADTAFLLEGISFEPVENDTLTVDGQDRTIKRVGNVLGAGGGYIVVAV